MRLNDLISFAAGTFAAYLVILGIWSLGHGPGDTFLWVGMWHPAILGCFGSIITSIVANEGGIKPNEIAATKAHIKELAALKAEVDHLKIAITDKEMTQ